MFTGETVLHIAIAVPSTRHAHPSAIPLVTSTIRPRRKNASLASVCFSKTASTSHVRPASSAPDGSWPLTADRSFPNLTQWHGRWAAGRTAGQFFAPDRVMPFRKQTRKAATLFTRKQDATIDGRLPVKAGEFAQYLRACRGFYARADMFVFVSRARSCDGRGAVHVHGALEGHEFRAGPEHQNLRHCLVNHQRKHLARRCLALT